MNKLMFVKVCLFRGCLTVEIVPNSMDEYYSS